MSSARPDPTSGPPRPGQDDVTQLLKAWNEGDRQALDALIPSVYSELHDLARAALRHERRNHSLQATALVNEAYLRLVDQRQVDWHNRAHFFGAAANIMRRILVDHARKRRSDKRGGWVTKVTLDEALDAAEEGGIDVLALDEALEQLAKAEPKQSQLVELRFFGGLNVTEAAEVMRLSPRTIKREWRIARMWLRRELGGVGT